MLSTRKGRGVVSGLFSMLCLATAAQTQIAPEPSPYTLSPEEEQLATGLARDALLAQGLEVGRPLYLAEVELLRLKPEEGEELIGRLARVTHYRYEGNLAIVTLVDLDSESVVEVEQIPDLPTRLSDEELDLARELGLADTAVQEALGALLSEVVVEGQVIRGFVPEDPYYGQRVVRLIFRVDSDYLSDPVVIVNLTALEVSIEAADAEPPIASLEGEAAIPRDARHPGSAADAEAQLEEEMR